MWFECLLFLVNDFSQFTKNLLRFNWADLLQLLAIAEGLDSRHLAFKLRMAVRFGTVFSNFKPKLRSALKKYTTVRYVGMVRLTLQGTGTEYALFNSKKAERYVGRRYGTPQK